MPTTHAAQESANFNVTRTIPDKLEAMILQHFPKHPFEHCVGHDNIRKLLGNYVAMSQAFPYLQAGAQKDHIFRCLKNNVPIDRATEITSVVGSFLVWDEMGGNKILSQGGIAALPAILNTGSNFHANLLAADLRRLFGTNIDPSYTPETSRYLTLLFDGLASHDAVERCAFMVAFEMHAGRMIEALWRSLSRLFAVPQDDLIYFRIHVGGDDPAEPYHVAMTSKMIEELVPDDLEEHFFRCFEAAYTLNINWCAGVSSWDSEAAFV